MARAGFFSRMANEASMALSDAYGHVMHGDDAGSSAKLVWVVHPTTVPINTTTNNNNTDGATNMESSGVGGGGVGGEGNNNSNSNPQSPGRENNGSNYLYTQKFGKLYLYVWVVFVDKSLKYYIGAQHVCQQVFWGELVYIVCWCCCLLKIH